MNGREALEAWAAHIMQSDSITVAETWDPVRGWRAAIALSTGRTLVMSAREMRKMADRFSKAGRAAIEAAGIAQVVADMYDVAEVVKRKNARREVPDGIVRDLPSAVSA